MDIKKIMGFVIIIILLIIVITYMLRDISTLSGLTQATVLQKVDPANLDNSNPNSSNFTYSIWFYIDDWSYKYGEPKFIFGRMSQGADATNIAKEPCP